MTTLEQLAQLQKDWRVQLVSYPSDVGYWSLTLTHILDESPVGPGHVYHGTLESVIARAHAGERGEFDRPTVMQRRRQEIIDEGD